MASVGASDGIVSRHPAGSRPKRRVRRDSDPSERAGSGTLLDDRVRERSGSLARRDGGRALRAPGAAASVGALHTLAPDHWVPFAALARTQRWSAAKTARVTFLCGFGHVTVSALLGLFGLAYGAWGLKRAAGRRVHGHVHSHYDHIHETSEKTAWSLFVLFSADPCVAVIPLLFAAAPLGTAPTVGLVLLYEAATIATMIVLVLPARAGISRLRFPWLDHWGDALAGGLIAATGVVVMALGI